MGDSVIVDKYPKCDFCPMEQTSDAWYDGKTQMGPWGNMCKPHFHEYGTGLGTGRGQRYLLRSYMDLYEIDLDHDLGVRDLTDPFTGEMV